MAISAVRPGTFSVEEQNMVVTNVNASKVWLPSATSTFTEKTLKVYLCLAV